MKDEAGSRLDKFLASPKRREPERILRQRYWGGAWSEWTSTAPRSTPKERGAGAPQPWTVRRLLGEEFIGGQLITCAGSGGCRSVFNGSPLTLRSIADAVVYVGNGDQADARAK